MPEKIQSFGLSLQLVPSQHQALMSKLESAQKDNSNTTSNNIDLACQVAQDCLGADCVEKEPVN